jgi:hypothetical protein
MGITSSLFNTMAAHPTCYVDIIADAVRTGHLVILDDSKCETSVSNKLEVEALRAGVKSIHLIKREMTEDSFRPNSEIFEVCVNNVLKKYKQK